MKKRIIGFLIFFSTWVQAAVQVQVDSPQVGIDESFRLTITQENTPNTPNSGIPDFTSLQKEFILLGTEQRMSYSLINGQAQSSTQWSVILKAQRAGTLTIPSLKIGQEHTTPITIEVTSNPTSPNTTSRANTPQNNSDVYLKTSVTKKNPYVNQQIIYKVSFYNSQRLLNVNYQAPQVENALLIPLGAEKQYQTQKNNRTYLVEEQNYAIFPQKSGPLTIKSPILNALVYDFNPQRIHAQDKDIHLNIQPIPKSYSGNQWLPAKKVILTEHYDNGAQHLSQGNTLVRTITLSGTGIPAQLLPNLNIKKAPGFNVYPERGEPVNQLIQGELIGRIDIKVTYLLNKSGKITIPELTLPWFNTETGTEETATLPEKILEISPATSTPITYSTPTPAKNTAVTQPAQEANKKSVRPQHKWARNSVAFFTFVCLLALVLRLWRTKNNAEKKQYKSALNALEKSCRQNKAQHTREALVTWARLHWPKASILNLSDVAHQTTDAFFKKQIHDLEQALYSPQEKTLWQGKHLWNALCELKKNKRVQKEKRDSLPPINPC